MPILRLNAGPDGLALHRSPAAALATLTTAARGCGPIIVLIHGFKYDPTDPRHCPHDRLFSLAAQERAQWLRPLGFGCGDLREGLAIAFGWQARGHLWQAQASARTAGFALAHALRRIRTAAPHRPIHVISHSMGSEVIFAALHHLPRDTVKRIITITGASYASTAREAMTTAAGRTAELLNITSRENDLFDLMFERLIAPPAPGDRAMSTDLTLPNSLTLQLDCPRTLGVLSQFGAQIAAPSRRVCHWSGYTRGGALPFYARVIRQADTLPLAALRCALPAVPSPRWSRMFALPAVPIPLPGRQKPAS